MSVASLSATGPDLLRLLAIPAFAWVALADLRVRRVERWVWIPIATLAVATLLWEARLAATAGEVTWLYEFLVPAAISIGMVVPIAYLFWWLGLFGGADARALFVIAVWFATAPSYTVGSQTLPLVASPHGAFAFTVLVNAVLVGAVVPLALFARNAIAGEFSTRMLVARPVPVESLETTPGWLLEPDAGPFDTVDLDALRMYLRWRDLTVADLRSRPDHFRDPASLPAEPGEPTDGRIDVETDGGRPVDDPWGARTFLAAIEGTAYGTDPASLRRGLEVIVAEDRLWVSPGLPFLVFVFGGLLLGLCYGDPIVALTGR